MIRANPGSLHIGTRFAPCTRVLDTGPDAPPVSFYEAVAAEVSVSGGRIFAELTTTNALFTGRITDVVAAALPPADFASSTLGTATLAERQLTWLEGVVQGRVTFIFGMTAKVWIVPRVVGARGFGRVRGAKTFELGVRFAILAARSVRYADRTGSIL